MEDRRMHDEKFNQLEAQVTKHIAECNLQFNELRELVRSNVRCVGELIDAQKESTVAITNLAKETQGVVEVYNNVSGAVKVGSAVQNFGFWLMKWGVIGAGIYTGIKFVSSWIHKLFP
jgi:hypothetical protein